MMRNDAFENETGNLKSLSGAIEAGEWATTEECYQKLQAWELSAGPRGCLLTGLLSSGEFAALHECSRTEQGSQSHGRSKYRIILQSPANVGCEKDSWNNIIKW